MSIPHGKLEPKRENDKESMHCALEFCDKHSELKAINRVRMLHQVVSLADISFADGGGLEKSTCNHSKLKHKGINLIGPRNTI